MSLLLYSNPSFTSLPPLLSSPSSCSSPALPLMAPPAALRMPMKPIHLPTKSFGRIGVQSRNGVFVVKAASSEAESPAGQPPAEPKEEGSVVAVDKLPLESKMQERMAQKLKMKLAKKIRLRRKRLVRKRRLRKKGRWPPSKMKKNKNV